MSEKRKNDDERAVESAPPGPSTWSYDATRDPAYRVREVWSPNPCVGGGDPAPAEAANPPDAASVASEVENVLSDWQSSDPVGFEAVGEAYSVEAVQTALDAVGLMEIGASASADPLWDEYGTPTRKQPDCPKCGEDEVGSHFNAAWCHLCSWRGSVEELRGSVRADRNLKIFGELLDLVDERERALAVDREGWVERLLQAGFRPADLVYAIPRATRGVDASREIRHVGGAVLVTLPSVPGGIGVWHGTAIRQALNSETGAARDCGAELGPVGCTDPECDFSNCVRLDRGATCESGQNAVSKPIELSRAPLVWIDLETTGLAPGCRILEVALAVTDAELELLREPARCTIWLSKYDAIEPGAREMHERSGLLAECAADRHDFSDEHSAENWLLDRLRDLGVEAGAAPLAGSGVHFDRRVLADRMPRLHDYLHYRNVDASTLLELAARWRPELHAELMAMRRGLHRALPDLEDSIACLRRLRRCLFGEEVELSVAIDEDRVSALARRHVEPVVVEAVELGGAVERLAALLLPAGELAALRESGARPLEVAAALERRASGRVDALATPFERAAVELIDEVLRRAGTSGDWRLWWHPEGDGEVRLFAESTDVRHLRGTVVLASIVKGARPGVTAEVVLPWRRAEPDGWPPRATWVSGLTAGSRSAAAAVLRGLDALRADPDGALRWSTAPHDLRVSASTTPKTMVDWRGRAGREAVEGLAASAICGRDPVAPGWALRPSRGGAILLAREGLDERPPGETLGVVARVRLASDRWPAQLEVLVGEPGGPSRSWVLLRGVDDAAEAGAELGRLCASLVAAHERGESIDGRIARNGLFGGDARAGATGPGAQLAPPRREWWRRGPTPRERAVEEAFGALRSGALRRLKFRHDLLLDQAGLVHLVNADGGSLAAVARVEARESGWPVVVTLLESPENQPRRTCAGPDDVPVAALVDLVLRVLDREVRPC